jgi:hypothetical protein
MNRRFVRSVRRATPDRPGAHRVNRSAVDGCSSTSGTASRPSGIAQSASFPAAKTTGRWLSADQQRDYTAWIDNDRRLHELLAHLEALGAAAFEAKRRRGYIY